MRLWKMLAFIVIMLAVPFLSGCALTSIFEGSEEKTLKNPNDVMGTAYLWQLNDHSKISVILSGVSDAGFLVNKQTVTDSSGNWLLERVPNGTYTLLIRAQSRSSPNGIGSIKAIGAEMTVRVEFSGVVVDPVTLPVFSNTSLRATQNPGLIIHSQDEWEFVNDPNEADLWITKTTLSTPGRNDLVWLDLTPAQKHSYWLGDVIEIPEDGYQEYATHSGLYIFRTRSGRYVKMRTDGPGPSPSANIQFVVLPEDADGKFPY